LSPVGTIDGSPPVHWRVIRINSLGSPVGTIDGSPPVHWRVIRTNPLWSPVGTIECPPYSTVLTGLANGLARDYPPLKKRAMINRPYGTEWKCTVNFNVIALD